MKYILFIFAFLFSAMIGYAQTLTDHNRAIIWRGFHHQWMYNHRINCIGDYVLRFDNAHGGYPTVTHTSATGTGPDHTRYDSYYSLIESGSAVFAEFSEHIIDTGNFDHMTPDKRDFLIPLKDINPAIRFAYMAGKEKYVTVLNGFELNSIGASDKLRKLNIEILDNGYDNATQTLKVRINTDITLDCNSAECKKGISFFTYDFDVYFLIIGYNDTDVVATQSNFTVPEKWDTMVELKDSVVYPDISLNNSCRFPYATAGIKSIAIELDTGLHLLQWDNMIDVPVITGNGKDKRMEVPALIQFKQWRNKMKCAHPFESFFCYREAGYGHITVGLVALQFKDISTLSYQHHSQNPVMFWPGWGRKSYNDSTATFDYRAIQIYNIATNKMETK